MTFRGIDNLMKSDLIQRLREGQLTAEDVPAILESIRLASEAEIAIKKIEQKASEKRALIDQQRRAASMAGVMARRHVSDELANDVRHHARHLMAAKSYKYRRELASDIKNEISTDYSIRSIERIIEKYNLM